MVLYCEHPLLGVKKIIKPFLHLSLAKAGPFTLESNVCVKALKCKVSQIIRCLIKPLLKHSIQTIFQGGTSWVAQLLNNIIVWMVLYCEHPLLGVKKKIKPFLHLSLAKAGPFTLESNVCVKALKCKVSQIIRCLIKPLLKNSTQTIFQGYTSWLAQLLNNIIVWMVLYCEHQLLGVKKKIKPFLHLSLGKAGPFTLESHIYVKALKCKVFQIIRCLIKPLLKNSTQTIFQGDTSWLAQLLNNIIVWMVLYCEHQLVGVKKTQNPFSISLGKADAFTLESHICVKTLKCKVFQIIRYLKKP